MATAVAGLAGSATGLLAQHPGVDIWLTELRVEGDSLRAGSPRNVTRRPGYDSQPCFVPDGSAFLYVAADSADRTDVYLLEIGSGRSRRVTASTESEYSPTPSPAPHEGFTAVRVEADSTQRLWQFDAHGGGARLLSSGVDSVGYFAWVDANRLAVFIVGTPHTLRMIELSPSRERMVARDIGRSILLAPGGRGVSFVTRRQDEDAYNFFLLTPSGETTPLIQAVGGGQDAVWVGETLLMAQGARLFAARPFAGSGWRQVADFSGDVAGTINRLAVSADRRRLAFVATETVP